MARPRTAPMTVVVRAPSDSRERKPELSTNAAWPVYPALGKKKPGSHSRE
jgi:hypothetical protein